MVTRCYNTCFPAYRNAEDYLLVDAGGGNGILSRLEEAQIPVEKNTLYVRHPFPHGSCAGRGLDDTEGGHNDARRLL